jgi:hypothetical protein
MTVFDDPLADTPAYGAAYPAQAEAQGRFQADVRLFELSGAVGIDQANRRADVFKLQTLLYREGYLDGVALPEGETISAFRDFYATLAAVPLSNPMASQSRAA